MSVNLVWSTAKVLFKGICNNCNLALYYVLSSHMSFVMITDYSYTIDAVLLLMLLTFSIKKKKKVLTAAEYNLLKSSSMHCWTFPKKGSPPILWSITVKFHHNFLFPHIQSLLGKTLHGLILDKYCSIQLCIILNTSTYIKIPIIVCTNDIRLALLIDLMQHSWIILDTGNGGCEN